MLGFFETSWQCPVGMVMIGLFLIVILLTDPFIRYRNALLCCSLRIAALC